MNKISRKGFLKIAAAAAMSGVTAGALAACESASSAASSAVSSGAGSVASGATYIPGTYEGTAQGISSTVKVTMTFSETAVTDVVVDTSGETASYGAAAADELRQQLLEAGSAEIDGVSGSTITSDAVMKAAQSCYAQAKGEAVVTAVQLPSGDENDWLGTEPDIDEAAITETWDTDIVIVGAGNGGMCAAAYAAQNGLNFRIIEQNVAVQDTRHWYGAIDTSAAQAAGAEPCDRAKLLSEISRYASGKCDQRVVKTWIEESAAMHDFVAGILEGEYGWTCEFTSGSEAAWPAENAEHNTDYLFPVEEHNYMASETASGMQRNQVFQDYIEKLGYSIDFNTALAKIEKDDTGRVTGIIAQSNDDGHFIRINAAKGVLLACGGYPGNPYMMEQLDPLGTSVTTACSYSPADRGYGIRAAVWAGANLDKEAAPMLFDRGVVPPGQDAGYVEPRHPALPESQPQRRALRQREQPLQRHRLRRGPPARPGLRPDPRRQLVRGRPALPHHRLLGPDPQRRPRLRAAQDGGGRGCRLLLPRRHHRGTGRQAGLHRRGQGKLPGHRRALQRAVRRPGGHRLRQAGLPPERHPQSAVLRLLAGRFAADHRTGHRHQRKDPGSGHQQRAHPRSVRHRRYVGQLLCQQLPLPDGGRGHGPHHDLCHQGHQADGRPGVSPRFPAAP